MINQACQISVCVCTYKRPALLRELLIGLCSQETDGAFTHSIVVVDNDSLRSAEAVVSEVAVTSTVSIKYCIEPQQNIALARNEAVKNTAGEFVAFIDDDEIPGKTWLLTLLKACNRYEVDGVLGPVKCQFAANVPKWVVKGKFYERATYPTGFVIDGRKGRTGNVLMRKRVFASFVQPFRPEFRTGEDQDFFCRAIEKGHVFIWCNEAVAYEVVPPTRWKRSFMLRRALLRGATALRHPTFGVRDVAKSCLALLAYTIALPFTIVWGQDYFMTVLVKLFDHLGKLLAVIGINPVKEQYVTE